MVAESIQAAVVFFFVCLFVFYKKKKKWMSIFYVLKCHVFLKCLNSHSSALGHMEYMQFWQWFKIQFPALLCDGKLQRKWGEINVPEFCAVTHPTTLTPSFIPSVMADGAARKQSLCLIVSLKPERNINGDQYWWA